PGFDLNLNLWSANLQKRLNKQDLHVQGQKHLLPLHLRNSQAGPSGPDSQSPDSAWTSYNDGSRETLNGDASSSSLAAKGFRSVRPNLQEKKSPTQAQITVNGNSGTAASPMSHFQRPFSPSSAYSPPASLNSNIIMQRGRKIDSTETYSQYAQSIGSSTTPSTIPICRSSEEEKKVTVIRAPHYAGIGPVDESGIPTAIRTVGNARECVCVCVCVCV
uniref:Uncharacterized protein n=1 Tax=Chelydra serpentina TaxID=8475 RepID=A0A8C3SLE9_CHESE